MSDQVYPIPVLLEMLREPCGVDGCGHCQLERQAAAEIKRLTAIVDRLPKMKDGTPVAPHMTVFTLSVDGSEIYEWEVACYKVDLIDLNTGHRYNNEPADTLHSTREAAEKARQSNG